MVVAALAALVLLRVGADSTLSGWASGSLTNSTDTVGAGRMVVNHAYASTTCTTTQRVATASCGPSLGVQASPPSSTSDTITNQGDVAVVQTVKGSSCAPAQLANVQQGTDPMLPRNGVAFQQADKWSGTSAATFSGNGYATDIVGTNGAGLLGLLQNDYSIGVWFKASDAQGGGLLSLGSSLSDTASTAGNPALWLDTTGRVNFAIKSTLGTTARASSGTYASGWHLAVLTVSTSILIGATVTATLYVDGTSQASATVLSLLTSASGYWHLGWADFTGLTQPTSAYFHGSLSGAFVNPSTALSGAQVTSLNGQASAASYQTALAGQGTGSTWMLGDSGFTTYGGSLPGNEASPCSKVNVTLSFSNPATTIGAMSLATFADGSARAAGSLAVGQPQGLTISTTAGTGYHVDLEGLHLYVPLSFVYRGGAAPGWTQTMSWSGDPRDVFWG